MERVHRVDGYPSVWPAEPLAFIAPPHTLGAWVAECGERVAGQVILRAVPGAVPGVVSGAISGDVPAWVRATGLHPGEVGIVSRLFVDPAWRGQGLARQLLQVAQAAATAAGRRAILDVNEKNRAATALYERAGWQQVATVQGDWLEPDGQPPTVRVYVWPDAPAAPPHR
ncbi:GNAT family N-acetyltransferase [Deinococcus koreensis]|uniref:GNAT family N-acetyltransferase n=1 Tax=Deinococcus koreensis TaxID=2054903 RepID=A0A2K3V294_9DEIO|nr:GNAT family N-acetyltransferase [Deinococcus koreensis]